MCLAIGLEEEDFISPQRFSLSKCSQYNDKKYFGNVSKFFEPSLLVGSS